MFNEKTLIESQEAETRWRAALGRLGERMESNGRTPQTHSGLPIKNAYFPHDIEHLNFAQIGTPGSYPFTRGNLAAQYQFMSWANQPVIGYGLPEHTRERMDYLAAQGMVGYFGRPFYNRSS